MTEWLDWLTKVKEANLKNLLLYNYNYMTFYKRQTYEDSKKKKKISSSQRLGWGRNEYVEHKDFLDSETFCVMLQ